MHPETIAIHAGRSADPTTGAVAPSIILSTTFERAIDGSFPHGNVYTRYGNPNRHALEECITALEGGEVGVAFGSGSAALASVLQALDSGSHVIIPTDCYAGTKTLLREMASAWSIEVTQVDMTDLDHVRAAIRPNTKLLLVETPSNPLLKICDIAAISEIAHEAGVLCVADNTWATPILQRPFDFGADVVTHSTTKYFGGHSDVLGGAVIFRKRSAFAERVRQIQGVVGAVPSPFDCWLIMRGAATLPVRMRAHSEHALRVATWLSTQPTIAAVHHPGLVNHPGHDLARQQMTHFGGMLSFQIAGGRDSALQVAAQVRLFTRATSLGGVESLIEHRTSIEGTTSTTPDNLLRASIGLEHPDDLIEDLAQALNGLTLGS